MRTGCNYFYKYLILYIVLSFIDNKYIIHCEKIKKIKMEDINKDGSGISGINFEGVSLSNSNSTLQLQVTTQFSNYSAMAHKSEFDASENDHGDGVTCYTCVNVSNNHICNQFAIDRPCKHGNNFCHTLHIMDPRGGTVMVNKKCANETECAPHTIGCYVIDNQKICISCCDEEYCNKAVPNKKSNAVFRNTKTVQKKLMDSYKDRFAKNKLLRSGSNSLTSSCSITRNSSILYLLASSSFTSLSFFLLL